MTDLDRKALSGTFRFFAALAGMLFIPAWSLAYWQAWLFFVVLSSSILAVTIYLMKNDPKLLERRMRGSLGAEKEDSQKIIQLTAFAVFAATLMLPGLDHRYGWSSMSPWLSLIGDLFVAFGMLFILLVFRANSFASSLIELDSEQRVISTGPYAVVRHPMYLGALVMLLGIPFALGSFWDIPMVIPFALTIGWRLLDEEKFLAKNLPGYEDYRRKVRYRLLPWVW